MFKGKFKLQNSFGIFNTYSPNDIVVYQGKLYKCNELIQRSPLQSPSSWTYLNHNEPFKGSNPPINPKENQIWISDSGINYIYNYDGSSYQWIAI